VPPRRRAGRGSRRSIPRARGCRCGRARCAGPVARRPSSFIDPSCFSSAPVAGHDVELASANLSGRAPRIVRNQHAATVDSTTQPRMAPSLTAPWPLEWRASQSPSRAMRTAVAGASRRTGVNRVGRSTCWRFLVERHSRRPAPVHRCIARRTRRLEFMPARPG